ncbi:cyclin-dependent kinases regulatory subunit 2 [Hippoglossus hippoglossus]|uniref:cyclin-dependent kinases regulatory subunit 2 n=1 Tax=Hippoglossus hippoglossus TaxID=8267 RepID=UPI00148D8213|nr:cyclin-dependent kinases regulatory subunit 2 [Hippoglossus hippoglossus]
MTEACFLVSSGSDGLFYNTSADFTPNMSKKQIYYSDKYTDEEFEYRHVVLPKQLSKLVPSSHLMSEDEWRGMGVQQSQGWIHYMIHKPEPHILLFRRPLPQD